MTRLLDEIFSNVVYYVSSLVAVSDPFDIAVSKIEKCDGIRSVFRDVDIDRDKMFNLTRRGKQVILVEFTWDYSAVVVKDRGETILASSSPVHVETIKEVLKGLN